MVKNERFKERLGIHLFMDAQSVIRSQSNSICPNRLAHHPAEQISNQFMGYGMATLGGKLVERLEDESAPVQAGVWNL